MVERRSPLPRGGDIVDAAAAAAAVAESEERQPRVSSAEEQDGGDEEDWGVIDDELLVRALGVSTTEQGKGGGEQGATDLVDVATHATVLELSYCHLRRIDHLDGFRRLTRLRLDNNGITTMENLEGLVHLTWLDLSFNRIERIAGLESLRKLTDLSLYHNRIHDAQDGLARAGCRGLQYLSLGRNRLGLSPPAPLLTLLATGFPVLEALVLQGQQGQQEQTAKAEEKGDGDNDNDEEEEEGNKAKIKAAVVAALPRLQYLDHQLLAVAVVNKPPPSSMRGAAMEEEDGQGSGRGKEEVDGAVVVGA